MRKILTVNKDPRDDCVFDLGFQVRFSSFLSPPPCSFRVPVFVLFPFHCCCFCCVAVVCCWSDVAARQPKWPQQSESG